MANLYIGLMSGTSIDGIDAALVDFSEHQPRLIDCYTFAYSNELTNTLHELCSPSDNEIVTLGMTDAKVAVAFADAVNALLARNSLNSCDVCAIGSHGQTVRHMVEQDPAFSLQIGDPNTIAVLTQIEVIADFRRKDIALGGQGAPLVPAFHRAVFASTDHARAVVNIGGISNMTYLPADTSKLISGFDTGPGNTLLDAWCRRHTGNRFDADGQWAAQGNVNETLLSVLLETDYFSLPAPKSTGRELFNIHWLDSQLAMIKHPISPIDVQATLVAFTAQSIALHITQFTDIKHVYICGGGAQNGHLMAVLQRTLPSCEVSSTQALGIHPDHVEAMAFAWLAYAHKSNIAGNIPNVTGASREAILGLCCPYQ
jgi:anhydro-N-acetylmuramic acid kinase